MKKGAKALLTLGIIFTVLVVLPVATVYALFYDNSKNPIEYSDEFDANNFFVNTFSNAIDNTANDHKIEIAVTEQVLNDYLHTTLGKVENMPTDYVDQIYMEIQDGKYIFNVGAHYKKIFSTKLKLITSLAVETNTLGEKSFVFKIENCKLARLGKLDDVAVSVAKNFVSSDQINESLAGSGVNMRIDLDNKRLTYNQEDLIKDINKFVGTESNENAQLLVGVLEDFLANDYVAFDFNNSINVFADLEPFGEITSTTPEGLFDDSKEKDLNFTKFSEALPRLVQDNVIDTDHYNAVFKYLTYGYAKSDDDTKEYVNDKVFTGLGIYEKGYTNQTYPGVVNNDNDKLLDVIQDQTTALGALYEGATISFLTENQANDYIGGCGFVGYSYLLTNADKTDVNYIAIDNFYCNLFRNNSDEGCFPLVAGLNFNGYETRIAFDMVEEPELCQGYKMGFRVKDIYFGDYTTSDTLSNFLFKLMATNLSDDPTLKIDYENKTIAVDFTDALQQSTKDTVEAIGTPQMKILGDDIDDNGQIVAYIGPKVIG